MLTSRSNGSAPRVRYKIVMGMLLFSVIRYSPIHPGKSNLATAGTNADRQAMITSMPFVGQSVRKFHTDIEWPSGSAANEVKSDSKGRDSCWREVRMRVTGYCPCRKCCGKFSDGITASGYKIARGDEFAAADRRHSFGTMVIVPGYNNSEPVPVLDRGGAIRGNRLDVFFNSHREAKEWGVRYLSVKVQMR